VTEADRPELPDDSVMVEVHAAAINPIDWIVMDGNLKDMLPYELPWIVGYDVSGVVTEIGSSPDTARFSVGDAVFARADNMQAGTMAEYSAVKASDLAIKPANISHAEAAGIPLAGLTAWQALFDKVGLQPGQRVLIHAGSGGVGTLAIQFAKRAGAWVATTASARNKALVESLGADQFVDYASKRFENVVEPCDVVFDMLGGEALERSFEKRHVEFHQLFMTPGMQSITATSPPSEVKIVSSTSTSTSAADAMSDRRAYSSILGAITDPPERRWPGAADAGATQVPLARWPRRGGPVVRCWRTTAVPAQPV